MNVQIDIGIKKNVVIYTMTSCTNLITKVHTLISQIVGGRPRVVAGLAKSGVVTMPIFGQVPCHRLLHLHFSCCVTLGKCLPMFFFSSRLSSFFLHFATFDYFRMSCSFNLFIFLLVLWILPADFLIPHKTEHATRYETRKGRLSEYPFYLKLLDKCFYFDIYYFPFIRPNRYKGLLTTPSIPAPKCQSTSLPLCKSLSNYAM